MSDVPSSPEWLSPASAAELLAVGKRTIYAAVRAGNLKAAPVNGRGDLRIHRSWLVEWLTQRAEQVPRLKTRTAGNAW